MDTTPSLSRPITKCFSQDHLCGPHSNHILLQSSSAKFSFLSGKTNKTTHTPASVSPLGFRSLSHLFHLTPDATTALFHSSTFNATFYWFIMCFSYIELCLLWHPKKQRTQLIAIGRSPAGRTRSLADYLTFLIFISLPSNMTINCINFRMYRILYKLLAKSQNSSATGVKFYHPAPKRKLFG